jgi:two-component system, cell cycle sensor histidine kinase and response regulator CckA
MNPHTEAVPRGTETLLLVEDEPQVRAVVEAMLKPLGYTVLAAGSASEAIAIAESSPHAPDLLLTDVVMPGGSGRELSDTLMQRFPSLRVLFMSGYTDDAVLRHGIMHAEVDFVQKPFSRATLARRIRDLLDRARHRGRHEPASR